jgi:NAD(P)H-hydrate repair Nnr-like enzyme with NAD(P)H-hydrate dehydratase domain
MSSEIGATRFTAEQAAALVPRRSAGGHKWSVGGLMIVAGAPHFIGAAALCAMSAGRIGAGVVVLAVPRGLIGPLVTLVPETAFAAIPDGDLGSNGRRLQEAIGDRAERCSAFVIGPGLGTDDYAVRLVRFLLGLHESAGPARMGFGLPTTHNVDGSDSPSLLSYERPIVVDADGLNILSGIEEWWTRVPAGRLVLTPHSGEMAKLLDAHVDDVNSSPQAAALEAARRFRQTVVLKGTPTYVTDGTLVNVAADAPLSLLTAGSGDVLAGAIGGLLAQGVEPVDAANLAVMLGSTAARSLEAEFGELGVVASDLPKQAARELARLAAQ